jgi:uncharacterized protein (UPF0335 family)
MTETDAARRLRIFLERIERLQEERKTIGDDIAEVFKELVSDGYDKEAAKVVLKIRKDADALAVWTEKTETVDLYLSALGMIALPAPARTREIIEEFPPHDAETGEIEEPHSSALPTVQADNAGEVAASPSASPAAIDADVPAFLLKERPSLRPLCQDPANCAGYGHKTCHRCLQAAGQSEAA